MRQSGKSGDVLLRRLGESCRGVGHTVELVAVHGLPDVDSAKIPTCHRIPRHLAADNEAPGRLGGRQTCDDPGGHPENVRRVPHCRL